MRVPSLKQEAPLNGSYQSVSWAQLRRLTLCYPKLKILAALSSSQRSLACSVLAGVQMLAELLWASLNTRANLISWWQRAMPYVCKLRRLETSWERKNNYALMGVSRRARTSWRYYRRSVRPMSWSHQWLKWLLWVPRYLLDWQPACIRTWTR